MISGYDPKSRNAIETIFDQTSIDNVCERKTLSGLDPSEIENCRESWFDGYFEMWSYDAINVLEETLSHAEIIEVLQQMNKHRYVGDFLGDESAQKIELSAYILILLDRFAILASTDSDGWGAFGLLHQLNECHLYLTAPGYFLRDNARKAAAVRHSENRAMKRQAFDWYKEHGKLLKNDDAAIEITKLVPVALRTAQDWVSNFRKQLRSASKA